MGTIALVVSGYFAYQHIHTIITFIYIPNWVTIFSMMIFMVGIVYAIIERNFIIALVSIGAAVVLPWVKSWIVLYWPYVKEYCFSRGGGF